MQIRVAFKQAVREVFSRPEGQIASLDGLRAIAITLVVIFHCFYFSKGLFGKNTDAFFAFMNTLPSWMGWVWQGDKGVDIFFVLSGFLIAFTLFKQQTKNAVIDWRGFFKKRLYRIMPVYVFCLLIALALMRDNAQYVWANLLFVNNFLPYAKQYLLYTWAVSVEMQFYLLFPLIFMALMRWRGNRVALLLGLLAAALILRFLIVWSIPALYELAPYIHIWGLEGSGPRFSEALYVNLYTRISPFILGILAAYLLTFHKPPLQAWFTRHRYVFNLFIVVGLLMLFISASVSIENPQAYYNRHFNPLLNLLYVVGNRSFFSLGITILIFGSFFPHGIAQWVNGFLSWRIFYPLARVSYSIYLFHAVFIIPAALVVHGSAEVASLVQTLDYTKLIMIAFVTIGLSLGFGILTYAFIERPFLRMALVKNS